VVTYSIGGNVTGMPGGASIVLQDNGGDDLTVSANGGFTFQTHVAGGANYQVTVKTPPSGETCTVTPSAAQAVGSANVTDVAVVCSCTSGICSFGVDGPLSVTTPTNFSPVETTLSGAASANDTTLAVTSGTGISAFDDLLIVNVRSTVGNDGMWEVATVASVSGTTVTLNAPLKNAYPEAGNTIVQRIPQYTTVDIQSTLTGTAWDPSTLSGGIVAFAASGTVTVETGGSITVAGLGYTGGVSTNVDPAPLTWKAPGESYTGLGSGSNAASTANAGGGAGGAKKYGCEGSGGGGGGHSVAGGNGGQEQLNCSPGFAGGDGGGAYGDAQAARIHFGSGGGAAGWSNSQPDGNGGAGGGMVFVFGSSSIALTGTIDASGAAGQKESNGAGKDYGGGGGGAGGSIYLMSPSITGAANALVAGGAGGATLNVAHVEVGGAGAAGFVVSVP
jgi:hypothetical protein